MTFRCLHAVPECEYAGLRRTMRTHEHGSYLVLAPRRYQEMDDIGRDVGNHGRRSLHFDTEITLGILISYGVTCVHRAKLRDSIHISKPGAAMVYSRRSLTRPMPSQILFGGVTKYYLLISFSADPIPGVRRRANL